MADGGDARFCSTDRAHDKGCQYFADGGAPVMFDDLVDEGDAPAHPEALPTPVPGPAPTPAPMMFDDLPDDEAAPAAPVMFDDLADDSAGDENAELSPAELQKKMFDAAHPNGLSPYEAPGQQLATAAEGAAQGLAGPLATYVETGLLGVPEEDIRGRAEANPWIHGGSQVAGLVAGTMMPIGQGAAIAAGASKVAALANLGRAGSGIIKGAINMGLLQASDEASKALLGQTSPEHATNPYMAIGAATLLGAALGGSGGAFTNFVEKKGMEAAAKGEAWLAGVAAASEGGKIPRNAPEGFKDGFKAFAEIGSNMGEEIGRSIGRASTIPGGGYVGRKVGEHVLQPHIDKIVGKVGKRAAPAVAKWLSDGMQGNVYRLIDYADKVAKGQSMIANSIDAIFSGSATQMISAATPANVEKLREYIDGGGINQSIQEGAMAMPELPEGYAKGGEVKHKEKRRHVADHDDHIAQTYPEQNIILQAGKARISQYLSAQRPQQDLPQRAYDRKPDNKRAEKRYTKALHVAADPLSIMQHIQKGTLDGDHLQDKNGMYPELTEHLRQKVTERIVKDQMDGKRPSYKARQALSRFMGAPLSSEFTPAAIQAAQQVFARAAQASAAPQKGPAKPPASSATKSLSKSDQAYLTTDQAREARAQKT